MGYRFIQVLLGAGFVSVIALLSTDFSANAQQLYIEPRETVRPAHNRYARPQPQQKQEDPLPSQTATFNQRLNALEQSIQERQERPFQYNIVRNTPQFIAPDEFDGSSVLRDAYGECTDADRQLLAEFEEKKKKKDEETEERKNNEKELGRIPDLSYLDPIIPSEELYKIIDNNRLKNPNKDPSDRDIKKLREDMQELEEEADMSLEAMRQVEFEDEFLSALFDPQILGKYFQAARRCGVSDTPPNYGGM